MEDTKLGDRLRSARKQAKLTQAEVCKKLNIAVPQTYSAYERNKNYPSIDYLKALASLYNVSTDWLLFGENTQRTRSKSHEDYVVDLFECASVIGLTVVQDEDNYGNNMGTYALRLSNNSLSGIHELFEAVYSLDSARAAIDDDDYKTLVRKRIKLIAEKTHDYAPIQENFMELEEEDGDLPF